MAPDHDGRPGRGEDRGEDAPVDADRGGARGLRPARDPLRVRLGRGPADVRGLRRDRRGHAGRADVRLRLPARGVAAGAHAPRRRDDDRALRGRRGGSRAGERLQRAQRPGRPAGALRARGGGQGRRRRGGRGRRRGLHPRARVRAAADRRARDRARPAGDADRGRAGDPRRDPVPDDAPRARHGAAGDAARPVVGRGADGGGDGVRRWPRRRGPGEAPSAARTLANRRDAPSPSRRPPACWAG